MNDALTKVAMTADDRLRNICRAFKVAQGDANAKIPAYLSLLIMAAQLEIDKNDSRYADAKMRADQRERIEGKAGGMELSTDGRAIRPGQ